MNKSSFEKDKEYNLNIECDYFLILYIKYKP